MNWPSATAAASSGTLPRPAFFPGKSLDTFAFEAVPMISKAQITAVAAGDGRLEKGANLLLFGPPGGKSHLASAICLAFIGATDDCLDA